MRGLSPLLIVCLAAGSAVAAPPEMTREEIIRRARGAMHYSYWWGHGRWRLDGEHHGACFGSCPPPGFDHYGNYGADCSGLVAKVWQVPERIEVSDDDHPYSTHHFYNESQHWRDI